MRKIISSIILGGLLLLFLAGPAQSMMAAQNTEHLTGKLMAVTKLSDRYKLKINQHILFIIKNDDQLTKKMIKTAQSLIDKKVTVVYNKTDRVIISIFSPKKKTKTLY